MINARAAGIDYLYRNQPVKTINQWFDATGVTTPVLLAGTKPQIMVDPGAPCFKTDKQLAGRAIVSDTFTKMEDFVGGNGRGIIAGDAKYAHVDGYDVLYGDGSVRWFGDTKRTIMWRWSAGQGKAHAQGAYVGFYVAGINSYGTGAVPTWSLNPVQKASWDFYTNDPSQSYSKPRSLFYVFNEFDIAAGIDVP